jgi:hypothetical protein
MHKFEGKSIRKGATQTGKLPDSVGFSGRGGGVIRKLTKREVDQQRNLCVSC